MLLQTTPNTSRSEAEAFSSTSGPRQRPKKPRNINTVARSNDWSQLTTRSMSQSEAAVALSTCGPKSSMLWPTSLQRVSGDIVYECTSIYHYEKGDKKLLSVLPSSSDPQSSFTNRWEFCRGNGALVTTVSGVLFIGRVAPVSQTEPDDVVSVRNRRLSLVERSRTKRTARRVELGRLSREGVAASRQAVNWLPQHAVIEPYESAPKRMKEEVQASSAELSSLLGPPSPIEQSSPGDDDDKMNLQ